MKRILSTPASFTWVQRQLPVPRRCRRLRGAQSALRIQ
jgi:hypothetical protein